MLGFLTHIWVSCSVFAVFFSLCSPVHGEIWTSLSESTTDEKFKSCSRSDKTLNPVLPPIRKGGGSVEKLLNWCVRCPYTPCWVSEEGCQLPAVHVASLSPWPWERLHCSDGQWGCGSNRDLEAEKSCCCSPAGTVCHNAAKKQGSWSPGKPDALFPAPGMVESFYSQSQWFEAVKCSHLPIGLIAAVGFQVLFWGWKELYCKKKKIMKGKADSQKST